MRGGRPNGQGGPRNVSVHVYPGWSDMATTLIAPTGRTGQAPHGGAR